MKNIKSKVVIAFLLFFVHFDIYSQIFPTYCSQAGIVLNSMPPCNINDYIIDFEDNFDGNTLDLSKWQIQPWGQGAPYGNPAKYETQEYNTLDNVTVAGGICSITAKKEPVPIIRRAISWKTDTEILEDGLPNLRTFYYTSSNIWTTRKFYRGKYEIKCRMPNGKGFWPAFWMYEGPRHNEIDVFDNKEGNDKFSCGSFFDFDGDGVDDDEEGCRWGTGNIPDFSQWHIFTCIFDYDKIIWQIDNQTYRTLYRFVTVTGIPILCGDDIEFGTYFQQMAYPMQNMNIIINLALRNTIDETTPFPSTMEIDYIRFYKRECDNILTIRNNLDLEPVLRAQNIVFDGNITIQSGVNVTAIAGNEILIKTGFYAEGGSHFSAEIQNYLCNRASSNSKDLTNDSLVFKNENYSKFINNIKNNNKENYSKDDERTQTFTIYPNPVINKLNIVYSGELKGEFYFELYSLMGAKIKVFRIMSNNSELFLSDIDAGMYYYKIIKNNQIVSTNKLIIIN